MLRDPVIRTERAGRAVGRLRSDTGGVTVPAAPGEGGPGLSEGPMPGAGELFEMPGATSSW